MPKNMSEYIHVNRITTDYGPGTKIIPTIRFLEEKGYKSNDTRVIYLDDDIRYSTNMVQTYEDVIEDDDDSVWTTTGFNIVGGNICGERRHGMHATIAEGYGSVCVKMSTFKSDFHTYIQKCMNDVDCRLSDDIILSNYYHKHKLFIKIVNIRGKHSLFDMWDGKAILEYGNEEDALHNAPHNSNVMRYGKVISTLRKEKELFFTT